MMTANINLLLPKDNESLQRKKKAKKLNIAAVISVFSIGIMSLVIFLLIQAVNPSSINQEKEEVLGKLSQLQGRQAKLLAVNDRVSSITEILEKRRSLSKITSTFLEKVPDNLSIDQLEISNTAITMTSQSPSLFTIGELINNLTDMVRKKESISSFTLTSLVFNEGQRNYQLAIKLEL